MATNTEVNLAIYMERLDAYIETQSQLNATLCERLESLDTELEELRGWRARLLGAKSLALLMGFMLVHGAAVIGSLMAVTTFMKD